MNWFLLAFISAIFSAVSAISEKKSLFDLDAFSFSFLSSAVTLLFTIPFFLFADYSSLTSESLMILAGKTVLGAASYLFIMLSMKNLEISETLPLLALSPGIVAISGTFFIGDYLLFPEWIGIFMMIAGTYLLELRKNSKGFLSPFKTLFSSSKYIYIFMALILLSASSLLDRVLLKQYSLPPFTFMALQQLFFVFLFFIALLIKNKGFSNPAKNLDKKIFYVILLVGVCTVVYRYTQIEATQLAPAALVLSVKRLSVLMAIIFGGRLFSEGRLLRKAIAALIILSGITILALY